MRPVFVHGTNIHSPLGFSTEENFQRIISGEKGVKGHRAEKFGGVEAWASLISDQQMESLEVDHAKMSELTKFEQLVTSSIKSALKDSNIDPASATTLFIISTTKGNIALLEDADESKTKAESLELFTSAKKVQQYFLNPNEPLVVSNACISGLAALIVAQRLLSSGQYKNAIVVGADTIGSFVFSGFQSFLALSPGFCKPFSSDRDGINLGEAAATMVLSVLKNPSFQDDQIKIGSGAMSNDANHISGPSRTGEELGMAINRTLTSNNLKSNDIDFISAHGTATPYNDEMEAKAINFAGLQDVPLNSLKGYFGHTLGAAGLLESIISIESMKKGLLISTAGFSEAGLMPKVNVCTENTEKNISNCLKMASGFGGCNATLIFSKTK